TCPPPTVSYTLSLHDALPISQLRRPMPAAARPELADSADIPGARRVLEVKVHPSISAVLISTTCSKALAASAALQVADFATSSRSEEHTSELQSRFDLVCRLL